MLNFIFVIVENFLVELIKGLKYLKNQTQAFAGHNGSDTLSKEIKALKKELSIAKQERDILKKALAICNSQPEKYMP
jgi:transposase-like protein